MLMGMLWGQKKESLITSGVLGKSFKKRYWKGFMFQFDWESAKKTLSSQLISAISRHSPFHIRQSCSHVPKPVYIPNVLSYFAPLQVKDANKTLLILLIHH